MDSTANLEKLFAGTLDLDGWTQVRTRENYDKYFGTPIPGLSQKVYEKTVGGTVFSVGVFSYKGKPAYIAWGLQSEEHCSFHARLCPRSMVQEVIAGCPEVTPTKNSTGAVVGFALDGRFFGELPPSQTHFFSPILRTLKTFRPLLIAFALVLLFATVKNYPVSHIHVVHEWMLDCMAGFFLIFGGLKVLAIRQFASTYRTYDLIAKKYAPWGYIYPFVELLLGTLFVTRFMLTPANIATAVLMSVGAVGIYRKLRGGQSATCACLGGLFTVPLTWVTFAENMVMAAMALYMLI